MDKTIKIIYRDILNNKLLEENIPRFFNYMADEYHTFASARLAMHYYAFYEVYCEEGDRWSEATTQFVQQLNQIISSGILQAHSGSELEKAVHQVDTLRNDIMNRMKLLTSYTDIFQIYEYILNRVEYRFKDDNNLTVDEDFARDILRYIYDTEDNVIINDKIREVVGQLPVRITRHKYFDLVRGSIHEYLGAEEDSLNSYLYMLRTSAMLDSGTDMKTNYSELLKKKEFLERIDYKNIDKVEYEKASNCLRETALMLESETSIYYSLQEIINNVYAMLICFPYTGMSTSPIEKQVEAAKEIIRSINGEFASNEKHEPEEGLLAQFGMLEGVQEELSYNLTTMEEALYHVELNHRNLVEGIMADKLLNILLLSKSLLSNSIFIDFYEIKSSNPVTEDRIELEASRLISELTALFEGRDRMVARAVMANTLNKMPVFFKSHKEVMDYVIYSLEKCSDNAEKLACIDIITDTMNS
ncbi:MAG TPA: hypothetical protein VJZ06_09765 [Mobilitalea sp.]|nr:hypothetical protein [Mobilitalea sp.]